MTTTQNVLFLVVLGCIVYFPVLAATCLMQRREISRLRDMLECGVRTGKFSPDAETTTERIPPYKLEPRGERRTA